MICVPSVYPHLQDHPKEDNGSRNPEDDSVQHHISGGRPDRSTQVIPQGWEIHANYKMRQGTRQLKLYLTLLKVVNVNTDAMLMWNFHSIQSSYRLYLWNIQDHFFVKNHFNSKIYLPSRILRQHFKETYFWCYLWIV